MTLLPGVSFLPLLLFVSPLAPFQSVVPTPIANCAHRPYRGPTNRSPLKKAAFNSLQKSTSFPKAGHINDEVLDFADEMIKAWQINGELGGEQADDVAEILHGLVELTFHSQRIARYLVEVLFAAECFDEAKRALQAYVQLVEKAREAESSSDANAPAQQNGETQQVNHEQQQKQVNGTNTNSLKDHDSDEVYANALAQGAYLVGRHCKDFTLADKIASKALAVVQDANGKSKPSFQKDAMLLARLKRVSGFAKAGLAIQVADPVRRPVLQSEALAELNAAVQLDDQSSEAFFQLAFLQAELRDVHSAIQSARKAVELEPADVESWHLLVLLLSAQKKYKDAFKIAEVALDECDKDDTGATTGANGSSPANFAASQLLSVDYPPRPLERNESILRLMVTYNALEELNDGVESAIAGQKELFSLLSSRVPVRRSGSSVGFCVVGRWCWCAGTSRQSTCLEGSGWFAAIRLTRCCGWRQQQRHDLGTLTDERRSSTIVCAKVGERPWWHAKEQRGAVARYAVWQY